MKEVFVLRDLECVKAIAHPRRIDILKTFDNLPLSAKQLSQLLDEPHAKINYHIKALYKVGILELVEEKIKSGIVEKYYYPSAKHIVVGKNVLNFSLDIEKEEEKLCISKFEDLSELFYHAAEENKLIEKSIIDYSDIYLTESEIKDLNNTISSKLNEIIKTKENRENREYNKIEDEYEVTLLMLPTSKEKVFNI